jgi:hypothetical protein
MEGLEEEFENKNELQEIKHLKALLGIVGEELDSKFSASSTMKLRGGATDKD